MYASHWRERVTKAYRWTSILHILTWFCKIQQKKKQINTWLHTLFLCEVLSDEKLMAQLGAIKPLQKKSIIKCSSLSSNGEKSGIYVCFMF